MYKFHREIHSSRWENSKWFQHITFCCTLKVISPYAYPCWCAVSKSDMPWIGDNRRGTLAVLWTSLAHRHHHGNVGVENVRQTSCARAEVNRRWRLGAPTGTILSTFHTGTWTKWKNRSEVRKHCALAVVRRSQKFLPGRRPSSRGHGTAKI